MWRRFDTCQTKGPSVGQSGSGDVDGKNARSVMVDEEMDVGANALNVMLKDPTANFATQPQRIHAVEVEALQKRCNRSASSD